MLAYLSSIYDYRDFLDSQKCSIGTAQLKRLSSSKFKSAYHKLWKLDVGLAHDLIFSLYSSTGRPAIDPAVLIRSFVLMQHMGCLSIDRWCADLAADSLLQYLIGSFDPPSSASHYDFIIRLTHLDPHLSELHNKDFYKKAPKEKPKKGEKLNNYSHTDSYYLLDRYKDGAGCDHDRMLFTLQSLFNAIAVIPSLDTGFIDSKDCILSGDGSSLHAHASVFGHKIKEGSDLDDIYRYSAPDADIGWDSDLGSFYLGFTYYNIAYHNPSRNIDLPVFISLEKASRHDALTCLSASAQFFDMCPELHPKYMCLDSASDSLPIYQFFRQHNVIPVIDHNQRSHSTDPAAGQEYIDKDGIPVCACGMKMIPSGYDIQRCRKKYRCPLATGKIDACDHLDECSSSAYGRVKYVNDGDDIRAGGPLSYRSDKWKEIYKDRTSTERINDRTLNDYHLHQMYIRDGAKHAFFAIFAGINMHLDAWAKNIA
jgi:hypothetical protein